LVVLLAVRFRDYFAHLNRTSVRGDVLALKPYPFCGVGFVSASVLGVRLVSATAPSIVALVFRDALLARFAEHFPPGMAAIGGG
jgi:hypothetical protein